MRRPDPRLDLELRGARISSSPAARSSVGRPCVSPAIWSAPGSPGGGGGAGTGRGSSRPRRISGRPTARPTPGTAGGRRGSSRCTRTAATSTCFSSTACTTARTSSREGRASRRPSCCAPPRPRTDRRRGCSPGPASSAPASASPSRDSGLDLVGGRGRAHLRAAPPQPRSNRRLAPNRYRLRGRGEGLAFAFLRRELLSRIQVISTGEASEATSPSHFGRPAKRAAQSPSQWGSSGSCPGPGSEVATTAFLPPCFAR